VEPLHLCQGRGQRRMGGGVERLVACDGARLALRVCKFTDCVETCFEPAMKVAGRLAQAGQYGRRACPDVQLHDASFDWAQRADCFGLCNPAKGWTASRFLSADPPPGTGRRGTLTLCDSFASVTNDRCERDFGDRTRRLR